MLLVGLSPAHARQCPLIFTPDVRLETLTEANSSLADLVEVSRTLSGPLYPAHEIDTWFPDEPYTSEQQVYQDLALLENPHSEQHRQMKQIWSELLSREKDAWAQNLWNIIHAGYERMSSFSSLSWQIFLQAHEWLPKNGHHLVIGAGSHNDALLLSLMAPERKITSYESSAVGCEQGRVKATALQNQGKLRREGFTIINDSIYNHRKPTTPYAGGWMGNTYYVLSKQKAQKIEALQLARNDMVDGGIFVMNNPAPWIGSDGAGQAFVRTFIVDAVRNGAIATRRDFMFLTAANYFGLMKMRFESPDEICEDLRAANFIVQKMKLSNANSSVIYQAEAR